MFSRIHSRALYQPSLLGAASLWQGRSLSLAKPSRLLLQAVQKATAQAQLAHLVEDPASQEKAKAWRAVAKSLLDDWKSVRAAVTGNLP